MKASFSEFSFGYALTDELVNSYRRLLYAAPRFPSLLEEGGSEGGYDVQLNAQGHFLFLQFKLSDYMMRRSAGQWHHYREEYYRFSVMPLRRSEQHNLLLALEARYALVFCAAPAFYLVEDLNEGFLGKDIASRTTFVVPSIIGPLPDNGDHHVTFDLHGQRLRLWSEPKVLEGHAFGPEFMDQVNARVRNREPQIIGNEAFISLSNDLKAILAQQGELSPYAARQLETLPPLQRAVHISRTYFDSELLIVRTQHDSNNV